MQDRNGEEKIPLFRSRENSGLPDGKSREMTQISWYRIYPIGALSKVKPIKNVDPLSRFGLFFSDSNRAPPTPFIHIIIRLSYSKQLTFYFSFLRNKFKIPKCHNITKKERVLSHLVYSNRGLVWMIGVGGVYFWTSNSHRPTALFPFYFLELNHRGQSDYRMEHSNFRIFLLEIISFYL